MKINFVFILFLSISTLQKVTSEEVEWPPKYLLEKLISVIERCLIANPVDSEILMKAREGNVIDDPKLKGLLLCIFDTLNLINHDTGEIIYFKILDLIPDAKTQRYAFELAKECIKIHEPVAVETAFKFATCLQQQGSKFTFI